MELTMRVKPQVVVWYKFFCGSMAALYGLLLFLGVFIVSSLPPDDEAFIDGILLLLVGPPFAIVFGLGIFWDEKPWHWVYGIVLICISLTSCCCFPVSIPLLIYWLKPETKSYFTPLEKSGPNGETRQLPNEKTVRQTPKTET